MPCAPLQGRTRANSAKSAWCNFREVLGDAVETSLCDQIPRKHAISFAEVTPPMTSSICFARPTVAVTATSLGRRTL